MSVMAEIPEEFWGCRRQGGKAGHLPCTIPGCTGAPR